MLRATASLCFPVCVHAQLSCGSQGDAFAGHVLSHLARSGQNLQEHWAGEPPTAEQLCTADATELTYLPADLAHAVGHINTGSGSLIDQSAHAVIMLAKFGFIRPRRVAGKLRPHLYDYTDYRLITYQVSVLCSLWVACGVESNFTLPAYHHVVYPAMAAALGISKRIWMSGAAIIKHKIFLRVHKSQIDPSRCHGSVIRCSDKNLELTLAVTLCVWSQQLATPRPYLQPHLFACCKCMHCRL